MDLGVQALNACEIGTNQMRTLQELMSLRGKAALVTGGAGHIGLAACESLLELGATVGILDQDEYLCSNRAAELSKYGSVFPVTCDLKDEESTRLAIKNVKNTMGRLDILVHCAAYVGTTEAEGWAVPFDKQSVEAWDDALRVNLTSAFVMIQEAREALSCYGQGSVILFGSTYGLTGPDMRLYEGTDMANPVGYAASKGGVLQLARHLATLLAPDIRVNAISPGGVSRGQPKSFQEKYISRTPLKRMATEEDLKGAIAYLSGDLSKYVTGHNLVVDGGWTIW